MVPPLSASHQIGKYAGWWKSATKKSILPKVVANGYHAEILGKHRQKRKKGTRDFARSKSKKDRTIIISYSGCQKFNHAPDWWWFTCEFHSSLLFVRRAGCGLRSQQNLNRMQKKVYLNQNIHVVTCRNSSSNCCLIRRLVWFAMDQHNVNSCGMRLYSCQ